MVAPSPNLSAILADDQVPVSAQVKDLRPAALLTTMVVVLVLGSAAGFGGSQMPKAA